MRSADLHQGLVQLLPHRRRGSEPEQADQRDLPVALQEPARSGSEPVDQERRGSLLRLAPHPDLGAHAEDDQQGEQRRPAATAQAASAARLRPADAGAGRRSASGWAAAASGAAAGGGTRPAEAPWARRWSARELGEPVAPCGRVAREPDVGRRGAAGGVEVAVWAGGTVRRVALEVRDRTAGPSGLRRGSGRPSRQGLEVGAQRRRASGSAAPDRRRGSCR